jgi:hypothetical protein
MMGFGNIGVAGDLAQSSRLWRDQESKDTVSKDL